MNTSGTIIELNNELNKEEVALVEKFLLNIQIIVLLHIQ